MPWKDNPVVPFDENGNMLRVVRYHRAHVMLPVQPMTRALKFQKFIQTSSSMSVVMEDASGLEYPMFVGEFEKLVQNFPLDNGVTPVLTWGYDKRGSGYGITAPDVEEGN